MEASRERRNFKIYFIGCTNWLERRYEIDTPKSLGRKRSNTLALSVVPHFSRRRAAGLLEVIFDELVLDYPEKNEGLLVV